MGLYTAKLVDHAHPSNSKLSMWQADLIKIQGKIYVNCNPNIIKENCTDDIFYQYN
jgi:type II restriction/modification system DNA methylase subunit YeeA